MTEKDSAIVKKLKDFITEQDNIHREDEIKNKPIREKYEKELEEISKKEKQRLKEYKQYEETGRLLYAPNNYPLPYPKIPESLMFGNISYLVAQQLKEMIK